VIHTARITLSELEQYLAKAADLLRGSIDQADFKAYIFPLMFFKRISDAYLEEFAEALEESGGDHEFAAFAENHRFAGQGRRRRVAPCCRARPVGGCYSRRARSRSEM
jgi:type I restriction enzyme M protein